MRRPGTSPKRSIFLRNFPLVIKSEIHANKGSRNDLFLGILP